MRPKRPRVVCHAQRLGHHDARRPAHQDVHRINQENFQTIRHELGHDYYYWYYRELPTLFQQSQRRLPRGIGDTIALSITPTYLKEGGAHRHGGGLAAR